MSSPTEQTTHTNSQGPGSSPIGYEESQQLFAEAYRRYAQTQQDSQTAAFKGYEEANREYVNAMQAIYDDVQQRTAEAYRELARTSEEAALGDEAQQLREQAYLVYTEAVQSIHRDAQERSADAFNNFVNAQQATQDVIRQQGMDAYREYLTAQRDAWVQLDVEAVVQAVALTADYRL